jgi:hypothetical protein
MTISGMEVAVCGSWDIDCTSPWGIGHTDSAGLISLMATLPLGALDTTFYLKVTSPPTSPIPTVPFYIYWSFPLTQNLIVIPPGNAVGTAVPFVTRAENQSIANLIVAELDGAASANSGSLVVVVADCLRNPAPGVLVTLSPADPRTVALATSNFAPSAPITDSTGFVTFVNVPSGPVTVTATPPAIGKPSGKVGVTVRMTTGAAGPATVVIVPPTPL